MVHKQTDTVSKIKFSETLYMMAVTKWNIQTYFQLTEGKKLKECVIKHFYSNIYINTDVKVSGPRRECPVKHPFLAEMFIFKKHVPCLSANGQRRRHISLHTSGWMCTNTQCCAADLSRHLLPCLDSSVNR